MRLLRPRSAFIAWLTVLLLTTACSAPQLTYNRLGWLVSWQLGKYLNLDAAQQQRFDADFEALWQWHRELELARYAADLRRLADDAEQPQDAAAIERWMQRMETHWQRLLGRIAPDACAHLRTLSDKQVQSVLRRIDRNIDDAREEYVEPGEAAAREEAAERLEKNLRRWLGDLDEAQEREAALFSAARELDYAGWIERRRHWRERFATTLARRGEAGFCESLDPLFLRPPARSAGQDAQRAAWMTFAARISATLSPKQREHLRQELQGLAKDFDALQRRSTTAKTS